MAADKNPFIINYIPISNVLNFGVFRLNYIDRKQAITDKSCFWIFFLFWNFFFDLSFYDCHLEMSEIVQCTHTEFPIALHDYLKGKNVNSVVFGVFNASAGDLCVGFEPDFNESMPKSLN